jgi:hypothetical protein
MVGMVAAMKGFIDGFILGTLGLPRRAREAEPDEFFGMALTN